MDDVTRERMRQVGLEVADERVRQDSKWGEQNHRDGTGDYYRWVGGAFAALAPHDANRARFRDWARYRCDALHHAELGTWEHILTEEWAEAVAAEGPALRKELIQVAAVAQAWVESIDRRERVRLGALV